MTDPTDWVMVPRVATEAMVERFHGLNRVRDSSVRAKLDYQRMIAAAPQPPKLDREAVMAAVRSGALSIPPSDAGSHRAISAITDAIIALMEANHG